MATETAKPTLTDLKGNTAAGLPAKVDPQTKRVMDVLNQYKNAIQAALPRAMTTERVGRLVLNCIHKNDKLKQADPISLVGAVLQCMALGLEPGINAHLVPFWNNKRNCYEVNFIADYRGLIDLSRRSNEVGSVYAEVVYEGDEFRFELGTKAYLVHVPDLENLNREKGRKIATYAVMHFKDANVLPQFKVLSAAQVAAHRSRSKAQDSGPWVTDEAAMWQKTGLRELCKTAPVSTEVRQAIEAEYTVEEGGSQHNESLLGQVFEEPAPVERPQDKGQDAPPETVKEREAAPAEAANSNAPSFTLDELLAKLKEAKDSDMVNDVLAVSDAIPKADKPKLLKAAADRIKELKPGRKLT